MARREIKPPALDDLPDDFDPRIRGVLEQIIYAIDLREGRVARGSNTRFVTIQDLVDAGVVQDGEIE